MRLLRPLLIAAALLGLLWLPPARLPLAHAATGQVSYLPVVKNAAPSTSAVNYNGFTNGTAVWQAADGTNVGVMGGDGTWTLANWYIQLTTAPGGTGQYIFKINKNEVATSIAVTISGASTAGSDLTHTATFSPGDRISVSSTPSNTPAGTGVLRWIVQITAPSANEQAMINSAAQTHPDNGNTNTWGHSNLSCSSGAGETDSQGVIPTGGSIKNCYVDLSTAPGGSDTFTLTLRKNGADTTLVVVITGAAKTGSDTTHSISVVAGDLVAWHIVTSATAANTFGRWGWEFSPTTASESIYMHDNSPFAQNTTAYAWGAGISSSTEASGQAYGPPCTLKSLYLDSTSRTPASGQTLTLTLDNATVSTGTTCQATNGTPAAHDTTHTSVVNLLDLVSLKMVSSATAGLTSGKYGFVWDVTQPASGATSGQGLLTGVGALPEMFRRYDKKPGERSAN